MTPPERAPEKAPGPERYRRTEGIHETPMDDETFLADPRTDSLYHMNPLGRALWTLLATPHSRGEMETLMASAFPEVDPETLAADIAGFLDRMIEARLVERIDRA